MWLITPMKNHLRILFRIFSLVIFSTTAAAQSGPAFTFSLGGGVAEFQESLQGYGFASGGLAKDFKQFYGTIHVELDVAQGDDSDNPYQKDSDSDICRDTRNGQFAEKDKCENIDRYVAFSSDLSYPLRDGLYLGVGFRLGKLNTPYAIVHYAPSTTAKQSIQGFAFFGSNIMSRGEVRLALFQMIECDDSAQDQASLSSNPWQIPPSAFLAAGRGFSSQLIEELWQRAYNLSNIIHQKELPGVLEAFRIGNKGRSVM